MGVALLVANYLRVAVEDIDGARILEEAGNRNAAYLCAQAAEKVILAVLASEGQPRGADVHDLAAMVDAISSDHPLAKWLRPLTDLSRFITAYRYPTRIGPATGRKPYHPAPSPEELAATLEATELALAAALNYFEVTLDADNSAILPRKDW